MNELTKYIQKFKQRINLRFALQAVIKALISFMLALHLYFLLWLNLPSNSMALFYANIGIRTCLVLVILYFLLSGYRNFWHNLYVARFLDRQIDYQDDLFQNTLELAKKEKDSPIVENLGSMAKTRIETNRYKIPALYPSRIVFAILFLILGLGSIWAYSYEDFRLAFKQFYTNRGQEVIYKNFIELSPGNLTIGRNEAVEIKILNPDTRLKHRLFYRIDKQWRELGLADNTYIFQRIDNSIEYYAENEVCHSPVYKIQVLDEPIVKKWFVQYNPPAYSGLATWTDTLSYGNIEALKHSQVKLSLTTNIPVEAAVMVFDDASRLALQAIDKNNYITQLTIEKPCSWYLELTDALGRKSKPEEKTIKIVEDNPPEIKITFPGEDVTLNQNMLLPLIIEADDDYGLKNCTLNIQIMTSEPQVVNVQSVISGKMLVTDFLLDLKEANLFPGDVVTYWATIYDNSPEQQKAESSKFKARFPSIEEIYREIENREQEKKTELETALEKSKDLQKEFENKRRELLKQDNPQWEDKKQLEKILQEQENLSSQVQNIADNYQELINKMQANSTLSPETLQKMQKIQELMQEINNEDLQKAMEKFANSLQNIKPEDLKKAMENFKFSMEDFTKKIEQTLALLESIKKEQAIQKALQISEEMEKMQKTLSERTMDEKQNSKDLASDQKQISDTLDKLQQEMEKIEKMLESPRDNEVQKQLNDLKQDMQNSNLKQDLQNSQNSLNQNQRSQSLAAQNQALEKMRRFSLKLNKMKESMGGGNQQRTMQAIQTAIRELLIFSKQHETTASRYRNDPYAIVQDLIAQSEGIQISLNKMFSETQVLMMIPPKFFIDLNETNNAYRNIFSYINETQFYQIPNALNGVQKGINLMVYDLMQALQNASSGSGSGGGGMQSLMQMLEQMSQEQMAMNMLTEQLMLQMQAQGGKMDSAMQQQIQRLAEDQERLAENLKRALQNNPEAQKQGNALKQITEEMDAITRQLKNNQLNPDILERQEKIISKMLDAQRSINKREFTEKRKAETGQDLPYQGNTKIDLESLRRSGLLEEGLHSYPKEYQQVIMQYLKELNEAINK
ncbi:MAG: hypothetical protein KA963_01340 [Candidatus Cloacimonas sp.]|nr:hypothetical protein [Candidatus Cloacimonas sp.]